MKLFFARSLNLVGFALLIIAGILAWQAYFPPDVTPPADVTIITADTPREVFPMPPALAPTDTPTPLVSVATVTPELTATPIITPTPRVLSGQFTTPEPLDVPRPADRKVDYRWLDPYRNQAFPSSASASPNRIVIPSIDVDSTVIDVHWRLTEIDGQPVSEWEVADYAVGFHYSTAWPGDKGNTVMTGHNNFRGQVFRNLADMKIGDEIFIFVGEQVYLYLVKQKVLVKEKDAPLAERIKNAVWIEPTDDVRLTLVSCWPYTTNAYRIIVVAKPVNSHQ
jgi:sortase A